MLTSHKISVSGSKSKCIFLNIRGDDEEEDEGFSSARLPDCIIIDILNRLPLQVLVRCQSKRDYLGALISSRDFMTLHLNKAKARGPMLLLHDSTTDHEKRNKKLYVLTNHMTKPLKIQNLYLRPQLMVNNKKLLCALYYCPVDHQFKLLSAVVINGSLVEYLVYTLKTQTWREIRGTSVNLVPRYKKGSPAIVNGALHWITNYDLQGNKNKPHDCENNGIIVFKMDKEQIYAKPHPGSVCNVAHLDNEHKFMMTLLVMENNLCFCHLLASQPALALDIWILDDYKKWAWNKTYNINLFPYGPGRNPQYLHWSMKPLYIQDGFTLVMIIVNLTIYDGVDGNHDLGYYNFEDGSIELALSSYPRNSHSMLRSLQIHVDNVHFLDAIYVTATFLVIKYSCDPLERTDGIGDRLELGCVYVGAVFSTMPIDFNRKN
ncbi:hypothetical protein H5410_024838 [Solanum commersonii]|uniref:F-box associated beta-propeller type 3 domain-containing protein n=1 Tax=Solanum commersonii TaxID=4109 RepID=A0A9J5ZN12_SOLCO|nr:hypothetical protein H5410_024838 [Solanum commersonii]